MHTQPFSALTPDAVLDALDSIGLRNDGRLLALNSYENRVYQTGMEDGPPLVAKFYRPARWPDAAILEEHAFVALLAEREIPVNDDEFTLPSGFDAVLLHEPPNPFFPDTHATGTEFLPDSRPAVFAFAGGMRCLEENQ